MVPLIIMVLQEDGSGSGEADVRTRVTQSGTVEVEEVQRVMKYSSLSSYMLKPPSLITQGFNKNKKAQEKLFKNMCNFGAREEWRNGIISVRSYLDVEISNDQYHLVNPNPLDYIEFYIMECDIGDRASKRLPQQRLDLTDGSISSYCSIINSPKRICMIKQVNDLVSVLCDIESDLLWANEDRKKRAMEADDQKKKKSEQKQIRDDE